jgi:hypothetical protein
LAVLFIAKLANLFNATVLANPLIIEPAILIILNIYPDIKLIFFYIINAKNIKIS